MPATIVSIKHMAATIAFMKRMPATIAFIKHLSANIAFFKIHASETRFLHVQVSNHRAIHSHLCARSFGLLAPVQRAVCALHGVATKRLWTMDMEQHGHGLYLVVVHRSQNSWLV